MYRPAFMSTWFCIFYLLLHVFPSSPASAHHNTSVNASTDYLTASSQFKSLDTIPLSFFITPPRTRMYHTNNIFFSILILLSGDIQSNPGPVSNDSFFNLCTLNIRSFTHPLHYTAIADLADTHNIHVFALTETWISSNTTSAQLFDAIPHGFTFISTPRLNCS